MAGRSSDVIDVPVDGQAAAVGSIAMTEADSSVSSPMIQSGSRLPHPGSSHDSRVCLENASTAL